MIDNACDSMRDEELPLSRRRDSNTGSRLALKLRKVTSECHAIGQTDGNCAPRRVPRFPGQARSKTVVEHLVLSRLGEGMKTSRVLYAFVIAVAQSSDGRAQESEALCASARRPPRFQAPLVSPDATMPMSALDPLIPMLMTPIVVDIHSGVLVPDSARDNLLGRLDSIAEHNPVFLRDALVQVIRNGLEGIHPFHAANTAASRYRWEWGRAEPLLRAMREQPSDRFLLPLSALSDSLDTEQEDFVFAVTCDVVRPLLAIRRTAATDSHYQALVAGLEWVSNAERILRHAERLVQGARRNAVLALVSAIRPSAPQLNSRLFERKPK